MEIRQLEYLVAIAETGSFSAAARRLGVRQPSVSEHIRKLEASLRQPLLDRLPGRAVPTAAGEQLVAHARRILAELAEAASRCAESAGGRGGEARGPLVVGAIPTVAPFLLPRLVPAFERRHPHVVLSIVELPTPQLLDRLARGELDVGVASAVEPAPPPHVQVETVAEEPLVLMVPAGHRLARRRGGVDVASLAAERFVALHDMHCLAGQAARFCLRRDPRPPVVMRGDGLLTLATMVAAGAGVSLVPRMMAEAAASRRPGGGAFRGCAFRPFAGGDGAAAPSRPLTLLWPLLRYRTAAARAFATLATDLLAGR